MTFTERYRPFVDAGALEADLSLSGLSNGTYLVRETYINRRSGSCFDKWLECGAVPIETPSEAKALDALSTPCFCGREIRIENHLYHERIMLEPLEVRLIELKARQEGEA